MTSAAVRLLPVPTNEPPYDDRAARSGARPPRPDHQSALPLGFDPGPLALRRARRAGGRRITAYTERRIAEDLANLRPWRPTGRDDLCDPQPWAVRLARGIGEVIAGARSPRQLSTWFTAGALQTLAAAAKEQRIRDRVAVQIRPRSSATTAPSARTTGGPVSAYGASTRWSPRVLVRSVRTEEPSDGACEISVHLRIGERSRAVALRAEGRDGRWVCTALQIG